MVVDRRHRPLEYYEKVTSEFATSAKDRTFLAAHQRLRSTISMSPAGFESVAAIGSDLVTEFNRPGKS